MQPSYFLVQDIQLVQIERVAILSICMFSSTIEISLLERRCYGQPNEDWESRGYAPSVVGKAVFLEDMGAIDRIRAICIDSTIPNRTTINLSFGQQHRGLFEWIHTRKTALEPQLADVTRLWVLIHPQEEHQVASEREV